MKAVVQTRYMGPEALQIKEVPKPAPIGNQVLVKVHAAAVNDYDWAITTGKPYIYRLLFGLFKPKNPIPGMELSGTIEALGQAATIFAEGDAVFGDISNHGFGSFADYICIDERALTLKPKSMGFTEAAAIPHASMLALQGLRDKGQIKHGQRVLINGGGGGVGTFGLQIAKQYDAEVTGVDTGNKLAMMKNIGFDKVIDYKKTDFTKTGERYDLILDTKTTRSSFAYLRSLRANGKYVTVGGRLTRLLQLLLFKPLISLFSKKKLHLVALRPNRDLAYINRLYEDGKIQCVIDGPYPMEEIPNQVRRFGEGKHEGKVVISMIKD